MRFKIISALSALTFFVSSTNAVPGQSDSLNLIDLIQKKYGISVLNKTDVHADSVLKSLLFLLDHAFCPEELRGTGQFRYLYAYQGHDKRFNIAAFHPEEDAISIGGELTYSEDNPEDYLAILSALSHEFGHVFLLKRISASELMSVAVKYGGWPREKLTKSDNSVFAPAFFTPHPLLRTIRINAGTEQWLGLNMGSAYGAESIHEWFAEAFAAFLLNRLGEQGELGAGWKNKLKTLPTNRRDFWINYNNITPELEHWFARRLVAGAFSSKKGQFY